MIYTSQGFIQLISRMPTAQGHAGSSQIIFHHNMHVHKQVHLLS